MTPAASAAGPLTGEFLLTRYILLKAGAALVAALAAIAGILYQPDEGARPDTWSIRRQDARIFFPLLYLLWIAAATALAWAQFAPDPPALLQRLTLPPHQGDGAAYTVLQRFAAIAIGLAILAMILTPLIANTGRLIMTLAQTIIRKWIQPGMDKMIAEGSVDAIAATASAKNKEWRDWLNRRDAALSQGQPFHEPAPDETTPA